MKPDSDYIVRVRRDTIDASGTRWFALENGQRIFVGTRSQYFGNATEGLLSLEVAPGAFPGQQFGFSSRVLAYPVTLGQVGQFGVVTAQDTIITVPAGTFHCVRYEDADPSVPGSFAFVAVFMAPQVGMLQRIRFNDTYVDSARRVTAQRSRVDWLVAYQP